MNSGEGERNYERFVAPGARPAPWFCFLKGKKKTTHPKKTHNPLVYNQSSINKSLAERGREKATHKVGTTLAAAFSTNWAASAASHSAAPKRGASLASLALEELTRGLFQSSLIQLA